MLAIKSLFKDVQYVKVEYVKNDYNNEKFHVYRKDGNFSSWKHSYAYKTLAEAEEFAKSRGDSVVYMGVFENGSRKGMTAWEDTRNVQSVPTLPESVPAPALEVENKYLRRVERRKSATFGEMAPIFEAPANSIRISRQL
jgi:hypothetical protein